MIWWRGHKVVVFSTLLVVLAACSDSQPASTVSSTAEERSPSHGVPDDSILVAGENLYSRTGEELIIRHFFRDQRDGFFVDVGSYHWKKSSNTLYLEERLGWRGIAIDALDNFRVGYEKYRPGTRFFNYVVSDTSGGEATLHVAGPLSSTSSSWQEGFQATREKELEQVRVPRIALNDLLAQEGVTKIDFLSMDIEGGEREALTGFDIERFAPELICVEASRRNRDWLSAYFARYGYERAEVYKEHDPVNWYFVHQLTGG
jgi:FkbM family methyltransferase